MYIGSTSNTLLFKGQWIARGSFPDGHRLIITFPFSATSAVRLHCERVSLHDTVVKPEINDGNNTFLFIIVM